MEKYELSKYQYDLLKSIDFSEMGDAIVFNDQDYSVEVNDYDLFEMIFNEAIVIYGMDNQDTVNDYGSKLYALYDELLEM